MEEYGFDFEIIEIALKKTTSKTNPNFNYINAILSDWFNNNLKTKEDIIKYDSIKKKSYKNKGKIQQEKEKDAVSQKDNFQQRKYTDEYYDKFFLNSEK